MSWELLVLSAFQSYVDLPPPPPFRADLVCSVCTIHTKQGGYECCHIPTHQVIPTSPTIIVTINALGKSNGIQNLKITDLHGHLLFDSTDPALLAAVDDDNDEDTSLAGVQGNDTSLAGVPIPTTTVRTNDDDDLDAESDHNSIDPNKANKISSKASIHSTRSHVPLHSMTIEPCDEEEPDNIELPELET